MRNIMAGLLVFAVSMLLVGVGPSVVYAAEEPVAVTIGMLPDSTHARSLLIRGIAPRSTDVSLWVNGTLETVVQALKSMDVYRGRVHLVDGENLIEVRSESNGTVATARVLRPSPLFSDVVDHWARSDIESLAREDLIHGFGDGSFGPDLTLTRAQFAKMVVAALGLTVEGADSLAFADTAEIADWAGPFVATAVRHGLIRGYEDNTFRPEHSVTRTEIAIIASRAITLKAVRPTGSMRGFTDDDSIPSWAMAEVEHAVRAGVISDFWGRSFLPAQAGSRAVAAAVVRRIRSAQ